MLSPAAWLRRLTAGDRGRHDVERLAGRSKVSLYYPTFSRTVWRLYGVAKGLVVRLLKERLAGRAAELLRLGQHRDQAVELED